MCKNRKAIITKHLKHKCLLLDSVNAVINNYSDFEIEICLKKQIHNPKMYV